MFTFLSRAIKITAYSSIAASFAAAVGPLAYEVRHNENQQDKIEASIQKITQEKFFKCDPSAAGPLQNERAKLLVDIMTKASGERLPVWNNPWQLYKSGVQRTANQIPSVMRAAKWAIKSIPEDYYQGYYQTALDSTRKNVEDLANLGIGICFDKAAKAGSLYVRDEGLIILNPQLPEAALSVHVARHLARLDQELVKPYDRLVVYGQEQRSPFSERAEQMHKFVALLDGPMLALDQDADANASPFRELDRKSYRPPLLQQPVAAQGTAVTTTPAVKADDAAAVRAKAAKLRKS